MKLTKKLEAEILTLYHSYWDSYLKGDMRVFASILDENCQLIGSAGHEVFNNKKAAVKYYKATAGQIAGKSAMRNRKIKLMPLLDNIQVIEELDFYVLTGKKWTFYSHGRISTLFHKTKNKWKIIHQHGSLPDAKAGEGQQVNIEQISAENIQLKDAVKRRTVELEQKNRELEIEAALERVRAVAMGMHKPDDLLNICEILYKEFISLGFSGIRNAMINIQNDENKTFLNYDYSDEIGKSITPLSYDIHPVIRKQIKKVRSANDAFSETVFKGKDLEAWKAFRKERGEKDDPRISKAIGLWYYFYSIGTGSIGISTFSPIDEDQLALLKRFRNVFNLSYRRYTDIRQAEAQAREANIQLALERVRSKTMAMHHSKELKEVISVSFEQIKSLDIIIDSCIITLFIEGSDDLNNWVASAEQQYPQNVRVPYLKHPLFDMIALAKKKPGNYFTIRLSQKENQLFYKHIIEHSDFGKIINEDRRKLVMEAENNIMSFANFRHTGLRVGNFQNHSYTEEENTIILRFAQVFEQTYTRFLDLQKAEAQAREAQIEAALERVRASSMAMHNSNDLLQVINVLSGQLRQFVFSADAVSFITDSNEKGYNMWLSSPIDSFLSKVYVPRINDKSTHLYHEALEQGRNFYSFSLTKEEKDFFFRNFFENTTLKDCPEEEKQRVFATPGMVTTNVILEKILLSVSNFGTVTYTDQENIIINRFAKVFEQSYTRFLDLQHAEAQARDAQVEVAVERVRAKALAMHKSEEILGVARCLREELVKLDLPGVSAATIFLEQKNGNFRVWDLTELIDSANGPLISLDIEFNPNEIDPDLFFLKFLRSTDKYLIVETDKADYIKWAAWYRNYDPAGADKFLQLLESSALKHAWHTAVPLATGRLKVDFILPPPAEMESILPKMAAAFDLAYKRFLDLQKAEAQAREAQIEAALERVRARTMAMNHSNDLVNAANLLFQQVQLLGMPAWSAGYCTWDEDKDGISLWMSSEGVIQPNLKMPVTEDPSLMHWREAHLRGETFYVEAVGGEALKSHYAYLRTLPGVKETLDEIEEAGFPVPTFQIFHLAFFSQGFLLFITYEPVPQAHDIFKRFAKVFEQTYTRFLDLQKSEAQARESQIQLSLERVRARTMAMQRSEELAETASMLFQQVKVLGINVFACGFNIWMGNEKATTSWMSAGEIVLPPNTMPHDQDPSMQRIYEARNNEDTIYVEEIAGSDLVKHYEYMLTLPSSQRNIKAFVDAGLPFPDLPSYQVFQAAYFKQGYLQFITLQKDSEYTGIFKRFAKVFEQTYTRFLDLRKAEEQARESQIELALERVRARAMAMQNSNELSELVNTVFKELTKLDFALTWCLINIVDESSLTNTVWAANLEMDNAPESYHMRFEDYPYHHAMLQAYRERRTTSVYILEGPEKKEYDEYLFSKTEFKRVPKAAQNASRATEKYVCSFTFCNFGGLQTVGTEPLSDKSMDILSRFGRVFDLTYTRFNDLKQAEAQAKESRIQLALERVRARTMAMQHSDELKDAAALLFQQAKSLGVPAYSCGYNIWEKDEKEFTSWMSTQDGSDFNAVLNIPLTEDANFIRFADSRQNGEPFFVLDLRGERMQEHYRYLKTIPAFKAYFDYAVSAGFELPEAQIHHIANFSQGNLLFITLEACPDFHDVFRRFASVFDQTYTRFLDLQKAEAQARESQIQLALERVRARTMAMQKSEELKDVAHELRVQLAALGTGELETCAINLYEESDEVLEAWAAVRPPDSPEDIFEFHFQLPKKGIYIIEDMLQAYASGTEEYVFELGGSKGIQWMNTMEALVPDMFAAAAATPGFKITGNVQAWFSCQYFSGGALIMITMTPPQEESRLILKRCTQVFGHAYRRFADLKKAEAQARESQIEAALERVRSRSMGMQKSEELKEVIQVVYEQFVHLNIHVEHTGFIIDYKTRDDMHIWLADRHEVPFQVIIPYFDCAHWNSFKEAREIGKNFFANHLSFEEKNRFYQDLFKLIPGVPEETLEYYFSCPGLAISTVLLDNVGLYIENFSGIAYSDEENATLMRFGKVFQQTYTRFLDLQKAEAQAREAKIEAALEKVRSRTMAMQHSEELLDVASILFQQVKALGVPQWNCGFNIWNIGDKEFTYYPGSPDGKILPTPCKIPLMEHPIFRRFVESRKRGDELLVYEKEGEEQADHYRYMLSLPGVGDLLRSMLDAGYELPPFQIDHVANFSYGNLIFITFEPFPEMHDVFKRFANVFEQTYTRFLDLQKAETQAREAKIEAALERTRTQSMLMQHSSELDKVSNVFHEQLLLLDIPSEFSYVWLPNEEKADHLFWATWSEDQNGSTVYKSKSITYPLDKSEPYTAACFSMWDSGEPVHVIQIPAEEVRNYFATWEELLRGAEKLKPELFPDAMYYAEAYMKYGCFGILIRRQLTQEEKQILRRFTIEFERAYTRFLDLQKAEAQAREAQIEAALERVRSRTMAMHRSEEIADILGKMFEELKRLDMVLVRVLIWIFNHEEKYISWWSANAEVESTANSYRVDYNEHPVFLACLEAWQKKLPLKLYSLSGTEKDSWQDHLFNNTGLSKLPDMVQKGMRSEGTIFTTSAISDYGLLMSGSLEPLSDENTDIIQRFGRVFQQSYTRYIDVQKAEAQAREAQIELGLERVRARAMAMQKSDELKELIDIVQKELTKLEFTLNNCIFWIMEEVPPSATWWIAPVNKTSLPESYRVPFPNLPYFESVFKAWKERITKWIYKLEGTEKEEADQYIFSETDLARFPDEVKNAFRKVDRVYISFSFYNYGGLHISTKEPLSQEQLEIVNRFSKVFDLTYTRFLDLQKAEAQTRESQIELGLERVRARAMAMQKSNELKELVGTVFTELTKLDLVLTRCVIMIYDPKTNGSTWWMANSEAPSQPIGLFVQYHEHPTNLAYIKAWQERNVRWQYVLEGKVKIDWDDYLFKETELSLLPDFVIAGMKERDRIYLSSSFNNFGNLTLATPEPLSEEHSDILLRFAKVFDLTYTRFNDLQKAEAQAREARIEAALEKVRSRSLAMHKSEELQEVVNTVFERLQELEIQMDSANIAVFKQGSREFEYWIAIPSLNRSTSFRIGDWDITPIRELINAKASGDDFFEISLGFEEKNRWLNYAFENTDFSSLPDERRQYILQSKAYAISIAFSKQTGIQINNYSGIQLSADERNILKRFSRVFEQAYTRFLDLEKAETQAREAQIEASLERVRSKTMAMHNSKDVGETVAVMFGELVKLGVETIRCGIGIMHGEKSMEAWTAKPNEDGTVDLVIGWLDMNLHPLLQGAYNGWETKKETYSYDLKGDDLINYYIAINNHPGYPIKYDIATLPQQVFHNDFYFPEGSLYSFSLAQLSESVRKIFKRFAGVFGQTYRRYLDLQRAETSARESQIEAGLERVRSRTLAMHKSDELAETAAVVFHQLITLGIAPNRLYIGIIKDDGGGIEYWITDEDDSKVSKQFTGNAYRNESVLKIYNGWKEKQRSLSLDMQGEELQRYFHYLSHELNVPFKGGLSQKRRIQSIAYFGKGFIGIASPDDQPAETLKLLERFAAVFNLTYTRFNDLQVAEAQAHKARIETALERVRARALAMQEPEELKEVAQVLRHEMGLLGVEELETCSIYIHDERSRLAECWYALKDIRENEKKLVSDHFPLNLEDTWVGREMLAFYESPVKQKSIVMTGVNRIEWIRYCEEKSIPFRGYYGEVIPDRTYHLYKFSHGAIGAAAAGDISTESWDLLQRAASVFSLAYSRFKDLTQARIDLQKLKEEKKRAEDALAELQVTQRQLIQSEKMASLGELTAGIAHEIQNPLNFVNNFSDVSQELLDEMKNELEKGNREDAMAIVEHIKQNLEKILHHGNRADAIVKGMLQHSRTGSGQKELADINGLTDEYLRLAYHGLRAKDKTFNAKFETDFDKTIEMINIVPQEIGRVVLNLINNAFYAVTEKKKQLSNGYEPTVKVSTIRKGDAVEIRVKDNGSGISPKVLEKIFQPFFTTKPTGQGTGLGLSMAYDIITKGHGGELKVVTKEGEGSEFIIQLPGV